MKKVYLVFFLFFISFLGANAQLTGIKNIPGDYADLASAITDLNTQGVGVGGVIINLVAGNSETAPAGGYVIGGAGSLVLTTSNATDQITLQGNGNTITASAGLTAGSLTDAIFKLIGADWVTIRGFNMVENPANITTAAASNNMTEWGVALLYATTTDGAQNNTIRNNTIDLDRTYQNTFGIYSNSTHSSTLVTTTATATTSAGGNSGLSITANTITDVNNGIVIVGPTAAVDNNDGLVIGGSALAANNITNYGTTGTFSGFVNVSGTVNGILVRNTKNYYISFNTITSSNGGTTAGTLRAIFVPSFTNAPAGTITNSINDNVISVRSGVASGTLQGIIVEGTTVNNTTTLNINNNDFSNVSHTVAASGAITLISNAGIALNTNINNNTFTNLSPNTTGSFTFISNSWTNAAVGGTKNVNGNSIVTAFSKTGAGGTVTFFTDNGSDVSGCFNNSNNNTLSNITVTGATTVLGLSNTNGGAPTKTVLNNTISNWTGGTSLMTGLSVAFSGSSTVSGNLVSNFSSAGAITGIASSSGTETFTQNTVHTLITTGASTVSGIVSSGGTAKIYSRNKIYNLEANNASGAVNGILISAGTTTTLQNNLIGDLRTPVTNAANSLIGISITGGTTSNAYYNTVYLNATSTGALFGSSSISVSTTPTINLRNNIFVNLSTPNGATGFTSAYRRSTTTLTSYANTSNNNLFFAGTPGVNNLIMFDGTNSYQTLVDYKGAVSPRDAASVTESPSFLSTSGANANFLHIDPSVPTQIESGGTAVSGITDDFDGDVRNATTPDMGADEFAGIAVDINGPVIVHTQVSNSCTSGSRVITATITDASGVPTSGSGLPVSYWRINTGSWSAATGTSIGSNQYEFTIGTGSVATDMVQYYFVAQDNAGTPNLSALPSAGTSGLTPNPPASATPPTTPFSFSILGSLSGVKTVGVGGDYTTLTSAISAYNSNCITGPVVFSLTDATYPSETFPLSINANSGASAINTLTIQPASGISPVITGSSTSAIIILNGADYVTIDGSNNGTSSKNLTITNTNTATSGNAVIWIASANTSDGATNNTIKNSIITGNSETTTLMGIFSGGTASISTTGSALANNSNNTIQNNTISKSQYGVFVRGVAVLTLGTGLQIIQNTIGTATVSDGFSFTGITIQFQDGAIISNNEIQNQTSTSTANTGGIILLDTKNGIVNANNIHNLRYTGTSTGKIVGIHTSTSTYNVVGNPSNITFSNNMVYDLSSTATSTSWNTSGISNNGGYNDKYYFNSVYLTGQMNNTGTGGSSCFANGNGLTSTNCPLVDMRNNIFYMNGSSAAAATLYAHYTTVTTYSGSTLNYNDLLSSASGSATAQVGRFNSVNYLTLASWQAATGQEANSISNDPKFISSTNLHINSTVGTPVESAGTPIAGITTDFDNEIRNATTPDIGADEGAFTLPVADDMQATAFISPVNGGAVVTGASFSPQASFTNNGTATQTSVTVRYRIVNASLVEVYNNTQVIASIATGVTTTVTFDPTSLAIAGTYTIFARAELVGDAVPANDEINGTISAEAPLCGTYAIGASQPAGFQNLTQAISKLNGLGVSCAVVFELQSDYSSTGETFPLAINVYTGVSAINTFTLRPAPGVAAIVTGSNATSIFTLNGAQYVTFDGLNSGGSSLLIRNTSTTGNAVRFINDAVFNNVNNTTIETNTTSTTSGAILFSTTTGTLGNSNNTIQNSIIRDRSDLTGVPAVGIYSAGTTGALNSNNTISNNSVFNYTSAGISISSTGNGNGWNITGNSFYQTSNRSTALTGISVLSGNGHTISGNFIGGTDVSAGGTNLVTSSTFTGLNLSLGTTTLSNIQNNVVRNIRSTVAGFTASYGINLSAGLAAITGNYIGSENSAERFEINGDSYGIRVNSAVSVTASGNTVNNFGTTATPPTGQYYFGMSVEGAGAHSILNNTISNITNASVPDGTFNTQTIGMTVSATGSGTIRGNTISNVGSTSISAPATFNNRVWGMIISATGVGTVVEKNKITNIYASSAATGARADVITLMQSQSVANGAYSNNMLSSDGGTSGSSDRFIFGLLDLSASPAVSNYTYNSVNITGAATTANSTYAFNRNSTATITLRNNIFSNTRTGGTGFHVAMANTNAAATGWDASASNYNDLYNTDNTHLTQWLGSGIANNYTLAGFQAASGGDANSVNLQPFFVSATDLHLDPLNAGNQVLDNLGTPIVGITTDIDEQTRSLTIPDMGADEFTFGVVVPITMEYFRGSKQNAGNLLDWKVNIIGSPFAIITLERSSDSRNFGPIHQENSTAARAQSPFNYMDRNALAGTNYYRLRMEDADGKVTYSHIVALINKDKGFEIVALMPNPAQSVTTLNMSSASASRIEVFITDLQGRLMQKQSVKLIAGSNLVPLLVNKLAAGKYQVTLVSESGEKSTLPFIKL